MTDEDEKSWTERRSEIKSERETTRSSLDIDFEEFDWERFVDAIVLIISGAVQRDDFSSVYILSREVEEQQSLIQDGHYASAVLRQSTFFETLLNSNIKEEFEDITDRELYNSEEGLIDSLGHKNTVQLAHMLGIIDERERSILLDMANWRNTVAHEWWFVAERANQKELRDVATTVKDLLWESIEEMVENSDDDSLTELFNDTSENPE